MSQALEALVANEADQYCASLRTEWDILGFMRDQFRDNDFPNTALGPVVTISGCAWHAQATTCSNYIRQNWPAHGSEVLNAVQDALDSITHKSTSTLYNCVADGSVSSDNALFLYTNLDIDITQKVVFLDIKSENLDTIVDVVQQLAWMGAALRTSRDGEIQYCEPKLEKIPRDTETDSALFNVTFDMRSPNEEERSCWFPLFMDPARKANMSV